LESWDLLYFGNFLVFKYHIKTQTILALPSKAIRILCLDSLESIVASLRDFDRPLLGNNRSIFFIWRFLKDDLLACVETWDWLL
jgi:hypothetical protein